MLNRVILIGRLTKDAELSEVHGRDGGTIDKLAFTVAVDRPGQEAGTDFVRCSIPGTRREAGRTYATVMQPRLVKGKLVAVEGQLRIDSQRVTLPDGAVQYRNYAEVVVQNLRLLSPKARNEAVPPGDGADDGEAAGDRETKAAALPLRGGVARWPGCGGARIRAVGGRHAAGTSLVAPQGGAALRAFPSTTAAAGGPRDRAVSARNRPLACYDGGQEGARMPGVIPVVEPSSVSLRLAVRGGDDLGGDAILAICRDIRREVFEERYGAGGS